MQADMKRRHTNNQPYTLISLFSGIGGIDEGLHQAGFAPLLCCEKDPNASETLKGWLASKGLETPIYEDVTQLDPHILRRELGLVPGQLDLLAGGPPCQSFSLIGKRGSLEDDRGLLLFEMVRFAEAFMPKAILIEQVRGLVSAPGADNKRGGALKSLLSRLEALGYQVSHKILRAADYGVPQLRDRLFIIGTRDRQFEFPEPTHFRLETVTKLKSNLFDRKLKPYMTVEDAIGDLPSPTGKEEPETFPNHVDVTPSRDIERITGVPEGDYLARQMHLPADQRQRLNPKKDTTKFRRLAWSEPSLTLRGGEAFYHPTGNRYLTPREFMRIHGFGDAHILSGPIRGRSGSFRTLDQHRQVANAVPPPLAKALGEALIRQILIHDEQELMAAV